MSHARIAPLNPPYDSTLETALTRWMPPHSAVEPLKLFRVLAHNTELMSRMLPLGAKILGDTSLIALQERELVINRVCAVCHCEYEWGVHVTSFGKQVGLTPEKLNATYQAPSDDPIWTPRESLLMQLVDELHATATVSDDLFDALSHEWHTPQILELLVMVGWYHSIAFIANVSGIEGEVWAERFPVR